MSWSDPKTVPRTDHQECMAFAVQCMTLAENTRKWEDEAYLPPHLKKPRCRRTPDEVLDLTLSYWHRFDLLPPRQ